MDYYASVKHDEIMQFLDNTGECQLMWKKSEREKQMTVDLTHLENTETKPGIDSIKQWQTFGLGL